MGRVSPSKQNRTGKTAESTPKTSALEAFTPKTKTNAVLGAIPVIGPLYTAGSMWLEMESTPT